MNKLREINKGFTVIEFLLVIVIIGILSSVIFIAFSDSRKKSRDLERAEDVKQVSAQLERYYANYGQYPIPVSDNGQGATFADSGAIVSALCSSIGPFNELSADAVKSPKDKDSCSIIIAENNEPSSQNDKYYIKSSVDGKNFQIKYWNESKKSISASSSINK